MKTNFQLLAFAFLAVVLFSTCDDDSKPPAAIDTPPENVTQVKIPIFDREAAYDNIAKQLSFGPRVPNTPEHTACKDWMVEKMKSLGAKVTEQDFTAKAYTGEDLKGTNIIAQYNVDNPRRILLCAHWDTRFIADNDPVEANRDKPVMGADDGGSGVGVLMEIARNLQQTPIELGVDIVFFDLEDQGESGVRGRENTWGLGSQHWSRNLNYSNNNKPKYGILLDMVGARNAVFTKEQLSMQVAPTLMNEIWKIGKGMGYKTYFSNEKTPPVTDDHYFVNNIARIPTIDIINKPQGAKGGFTKCWHTLCDDMSSIDKRTLRAVGQTVMASVYRENNGTFWQ